MITREFDGHAWKAGCATAPPPLNVHSDENPAANWFPAQRPALAAHPAGPTMVRIPIAAPFGDDPLDPANQTVPRLPCAGMVGRLNHPEALR